METFLLLLTDRLVRTIQITQSLDDLIKYVT